MITRLCLARTLGAKRVKVNSNSQLVVGQVQVECGAKDGWMKQYLTIIEKEKS